MIGVIARQFLESQPSRPHDPDAPRRPYAPPFDRRMHEASPLGVPHGHAGGLIWFETGLVQPILFHSAAACAPSIQAHCPTPIKRDACTHKTRAGRRMARGRRFGMRGSASCRSTSPTTKAERGSAQLARDVARSAASRSEDRCAFASNMAVISI